ncbi:hypothetical protein MNBD_CHLOROFLEXI01-3986 [hydrothermal vent metagenome]|uniref:CopG family transcriptional regulator n=1 Tax=hydrothermal vent metagenome TaxID=652676 RepID=A0A3B0UXI2_9ZZZZ
MRQAKFSLEEPNIKFLSNYKRYGYKDKSSLVRHALDILRDEIERQKLEASADLYSELYEMDAETKMLTDAALNDWPE